MEIWSIPAIIAGFAALVWGADRFVIGAASLARTLEVSTLVIGVIVVGFGTSAPEMVVSGVAGYYGNTGMAVGNALGSNIANIALVLGITALVTPLTVHSDTLRREFPLLLVIILVSLLLLVDGELDRGDGFFLLIGLAVVMYWLAALAMRSRGTSDPLESEYEIEMPPLMPLWKSGLWLALGLVLMLVGARLVVWGAVDIALAFGVSELVIGLTIIALGTSLPELAASVSSALKNEHDIAIGNVLGSNMFNLMGVLGIPAVIHPAGIDPEVLTRDFPVMTGLTIALFALAYGFRSDGMINRWAGAALFASYVGYTGVLYIANT